MEKKVKNQSYVSSITAKGLRFELERKESIVNSLASTLHKHGELPTLGTMREYQLLGADHKRVAVVAELEAYIAKVGMPIYLQAQARAEALKQVNNRLISEVGDILDGIDFELTPENLQYDEGRHAWQFTEAFTAAYLAPAIKTLTDEEQADFEAFQRLCHDYMTLTAKGYNITGTLRAGGLDAPLEELAERFVGTRGAIDTAWMGAYTPASDVPTPQPPQPIEIIDDFQWSDKLK